MAEPVIDISRLSKSFGALKATDDVSLDLRQGEIHALIGPNGAGKTSLIHQICGNLKPDAGSVRFLGTGHHRASASRRGPASGWAAPSRYRRWRWSFRRCATSCWRCRAGRARASASSAASWPIRRLTEPAMAALARVGLEGRAAVAAAELSHGERRQLEIAIALALGSRALLLDEPMAGMGQEGSRALTGLLDRLRRDAPILLVEHDMDAVFALADRVSVLVYGRIIASGTVAEIRSDPEVRTAYLGAGA